MMPIFPTTLNSGLRSLATLNGAHDWLSPTLSSKPTSSSTHRCQVGVGESPRRTDPEKRRQRASGRTRCGARALRRPDVLVGFVVGRPIVRRSGRRVACGGVDAHLSRSDEQLAVIAHVSALLGDQRVDRWLGRGWAVDFHAGRINREHPDVDFIVALRIVTHSSPR